MAFAIVALVKVYAGDALATSVKPELSWFSPFAIDGADALIAGVLLAVFIYWGWDSAVTVNEETEDPTERARALGRRSTRSSCVLIYVIVGTAAIAFGGTGPAGRSGRRAGVARRAGPRPPAGTRS